jgi:hypothetical protein
MAHAIGIISIHSRVVGQKACRVRVTVHAHGAPSLNSPLIGNRRLPNNHAPIVFHINSTSLTLGKIVPQHTAVKLHGVSLDIQGPAVTLHIVCLCQERGRERKAKRIEKMSKVH